MVSYWITDYHEQFDLHVIRFRSYQRAWMMREYRKAGEPFR